MTAFWQNLSGRERLMIIGGGVIVALCVVFLAIVNPLTTWRGNAKDRAVKAERNFELVRQAAARQPAAGVAANVDIETPVRIVLSQTASSLGFPLSSYNPLPDGNVTASANKVSAEQLFSWISELERRYGIMVINADIARETESPDLVRAQLTLGRNR